MAKTLTPGMKREYLAGAQLALANFNDEGSFADQLDHVLNSYGNLSKIARVAIADLLEHLPLKNADVMQNAFVARQVLRETHAALLQRANLLNNICMSLWEDATDGDFDEDVRLKAYEYDGKERPRKQKRPWWMAASLRGPKSEWIIHPTELLADGISTDCLLALRPLLGSRICHTTLRRNTLACIRSIRKLAAEIGGASFDDQDELILR